MIESELSQLIIGEAIHVHKVLGPGLLESVYKRCLFYRLQKIGLKVLWETPVPVIFEEVKLDCGYRSDIIVENKIIVEAKAVEALNDVYKAQLLTYLKLTGLKLGLLINFNVLILKSGLKRIINDREFPKHV
jgi:GxxExxY protein